MADTTLLTGGIEKSSGPNAILKALQKGWKTALFMEALRNLNWSRGYCWYCEMDGVPNPFQRGGVLGLPARNINFDFANAGDTFTWSTPTVQLSAPQNAGSLGKIQLQLYDDEQGTLRQFFERWYNQVCNVYQGVLPLDEACKQITIYYQKSTRRNIKRVYYDIDHSLGGTFVNSVFTKSGTRLVRKQTEGLDFLVYPSGTIPQNLTSDQNGLIELQVDLQVAYFINQDFGNPNVNNGVKTVLDEVIGNVTEGSSWLDKLADYI